MKKVIAAAAAFAMVAGIASVASAAVDLSGSARARFIYKDNYALDNFDETKWDSRVRVVFSAKSKGGAFAKARLRMIDTGWDGQDNYSSANGGANNVWVDYAYLGAPLGNGWSMQAGNMPTNFSRWFTFDERADRFALIHKSKGQVFAFTYDKAHEFRDVDGDEVVANDDEDKNKIGIKYIKTLDNGMKAALRAVYVQDERPADMSGMVGSAYITGKAGEGNYHAELAWKDADTSALFTDDAMGGYVSWQGPMGSMNPEFRLGFTKDGYAADTDFGYLMMGYEEPIQVAGIGFAGTDWLFGSASNTFQLSEKTSLTGNLAYFDIEASEGAGDGSALELSGVIAYQVSDGAVLSFTAGMVDFDATVGPVQFDDKIIGAYGKLEISY